MNGFNSLDQLDHSCNNGGILFYVSEDIPSKHLSMERDLNEV